MRYSLLMVTIMLPICNSLVPYKQDERPVSRALSARNMMYRHSNRTGQEESLYSAACAVEVSEENNV